MCRVPAWLAQVVTAGRAWAPRRGFQERVCLLAGVKNRASAAAPPVAHGWHPPQQTAWCSRAERCSHRQSRPFSSAQSPAPSESQGQPEEGCEGLMSLPGLRAWLMRGTESSSWASQSTSPWEGLAPGGNETKVLEWPREPEAGATPRPPAPRAGRRSPPIWISSLGLFWTILPLL